MPPIAAEPGLWIFWHERWQKKETGFHQPAVNDLLQLYWPRLGLEAGSEVFVPLCGRSLDMVWLADQGHRVIGAELSQIAIDEFFAERGLTPATSTNAGFCEVGRPLRDLVRRFLRSPPLAPLPVWLAFTIAPRSSHSLLPCRGATPQS